MRKPFIAGNWKMHKTINESVELVREIKAKIKDSDVEVAVCVPFTSLNEVKKEIQETNIKLGAQNMHWEESGAFTGEVSGAMLKEIGVDYVILGHSERRQYFGETDETVNKKIKKALEYNINPIFCVGETLEQRESGIDREIIKGQVIKGLEDISSEDLERIVIAYEPIWAIGTGKTASKEDANSMISFIRETLKEKYDSEVSQKVRIQYGGSVKPDNVSEIMSQSDIDGALVGGASLKSDDFLALVQF
ncbi:triosephosphate isomerase TpiA [Gottschalkia acidurici 9a]|uniref:Triosephosphate isomerase n=1 Tax=Gottschalkia acidurici (strain ATCC 7906 / DSM 604 / BCRC 14475 / CIP 104303 / KCTC 5404 / NCIMB 10678 / 9a) TaxID=1128398 RepID=K0AY14_GOTA9|nr:triose-phosphate isomerase [Gottschalkia acidurici]AFS78104.1 triosephosphate isomerase TpiA [Gottschalkia acidurici 9a]